MIAESSLNLKMWKQYDEVKYQKDIKLMSNGWLLS